jgi:glycerophosphoryl diester phosphodiesterase
VEFDVMLSACGTPILMHDETLERTTSGKGRVADTPYSEIQRLDAGSWLGVEFSEEKVPTFAEAALLCIALGLVANVEIKPSAGSEQATGSSVASLAERLWCNYSVPPLLSSFSETALRAAQTAAPLLRRGLLVKDPPADWLDRIERLDCFSLHCNYVHFNRPLAEQAKQSDTALVTYTVNDAADAAGLLNSGASAVITDNLTLARTA